MKDFRDLGVWAKGHSLVLAVYKATAAFPQSELYGLTSQIRRAASSIPANIAEGCGRGGGRNFARFLQIACPVEYVRWNLFHGAGDQLVSWSTICSWSGTSGF